MAEIGGDHPVDRADLAAHMGASTASLSTTREQLIQAGIIETAGFGSLQFTTTGFTRYIQERATSGDG